MQTLIEVGVGVALEVLVFVGFGGGGGGKGHIKNGHTGHGNQGIIGKGSKRSSTRAESVDESGGLQLKEVS